MTTFLTLDEAAEVLRLKDTRTVVKWGRQGRIRVIGERRHLLVDAASIEEYRKGESQWHHAKHPAVRPRRKPNTGGVRYKEGRALPYEAAFPLGHGKYRHDSFHTAAEAEAYLDQLVAERDNSDAPRNVAAGSQRIDQFLPTWLLIKRPHVKPKTFASYQYYCELAMGEIGAYRIDSVRRKDAELMLVFFAERNFKNVKEMRMVLNQAFQYAEDEDYITSNPFKKAKAPAMEHRQAIALTRSQRAYLLRCAVEEDDAAIPLYPIWHLYSRLGLRKGEGLGLMWGRSGVDLTPDY